MIILGLPILFLMLAAYCNVWMDKWMVKYMNDQEWLSKPNHASVIIWWSFDPLAKWENREYRSRKAYNILLSKIGIKTRLLSDNCNDAWHFFKSLMVVFICLAIITFDRRVLSEWYEYIIIFALLGTGWNISFNYVWNRKK